VTLWRREECKKSPRTQEFTSRRAGALRRSIPIVYNRATHARMNFTLQTPTFI
jgi:hypothetical protein